MLSSAMIQTKINFEKKKKNRIFCIFKLQLIKKDTDKIYSDYLKGTIQDIFIALQALDKIGGIYGIVRSWLIT